MNSGVDTSPYLLLLDPVLISDFFSKEVNYTDRTPFGYGVHIGFTDENGQQAIQTRNILNEFYCHGNSRKVCRVADSLFNSKMEEIIKENWDEQSMDQYKNMDFSIIVNDMVILMTDKMAIGEPNLLKIKDELVIDIFTKMIDDLSAAKSDFLNLISFGMIAKSKLTPNLYQTYKKFEEGLKMIEDIMRRKVQEGDSKPSSSDNYSFMGVIVRHIRKQDPSQHEKWIKKLGVEMASLATASSDLNGTTLNILTWLARNQKDQKAVREAIFSESPEFDVDELFQSEKMNAIQEELFRICAGSAYINPRVANRNFKIEDIKVRKGTYITTPTSLKLKSSTIYEDAHLFKIDRFLGSQTRGGNKVDYIPFSTGSRGCPGVKITKAFEVALVQRLLTRVEFFQEGPRNPRAFDLSYSVDECIVKMRPLQR